ncbi:hypothetical protein ScPMuIL_011088 [Solemya velum]
MTSCEVCQKQTAKYRCPGCGMQTCCLACVKQHKADITCDGVRNKTGYVGMKAFSKMNLLSDYRLLEDAGRKVSNFHRDIAKRKHNIPHFLIKLIREAGKRRIHLKLLPFPMSKRKNNNTFVTKDRTILWQTEWVFPQAQTKFIEKRTNENTGMIEILEKFLDRSVADPVIRHRLKTYPGMDDCVLLMKVDGRPANSVRYSELSLDKSLGDNLSGKSFIEYPTIYVVQKSHKEEFPLLEQEHKKSSMEADSKVQHNMSVCESG